MTTEQRLYIDGTLMDIDDNTKLTMDIKSNLFRDVTKMTSNNTYTVNLPKTVHNLSVLGHAEKPMSQTKTPYQFHACRYFRGGLEVIKDGRLTVLSIGETIEVAIYWGLFPAFQKLQESDMTLKDLKTSARLPFNRKNTIDTYENAIERGYFYASYNYRQIQDFGNDWQGHDRTIGNNNAVTYELTYGKIETGTEVGSTIKGTVESDAGYKYAMIPFLVGSTARISNIVGVGSYRSFAVLDANKTVLSLASDARQGGGDGEVAIPSGTNDDRIDWNVMWANDNTDALTVKVLKIQLGTVSAATTIEYGVITDLSNVAYEKWGSINLSAGASGIVSVEVNKKKKTGERIYLKTAQKGVLVMMTVSGAACWEIYSSLTYGKRNNRQIAYGFTYGDSGIQAESYTIVAPQRAAYLVINAYQECSTGTELVVTGNTEQGTESSGWMTDPTEQPSVSVKWLLELIQQQTGVGFTWSGDALTRVNSLAIPLVTRNGDADSLNGSLDADFVDMSNLGMMRFKTKSVIDSFVQTAGNTYNQLTVTKECTLLFDVQLYWSWDASVARPQGKRTWQMEDGSERTENYYQYPYNYVEIKVKSVNVNGEYSDDNTKTYIVGIGDDEVLNKFTTSTESDKTDDRFVHLLTGSGNLELKEKDIITFELKNTKGSVLRGMSAYSGFIRASLSETDEVPYGGSYPIGINLPEIKVTDFIKFLSVVTGTFPRQLNGDSIEMVEIQQVFNHWQPREDWTRKLIPYEWSNSPRNVEYTIEDYYRHNWYKWKEDDTVNGSYDADIKVDNETLEYTRDVWTLPFAATDGNRIPIYGWKQEEIKNKAGNAIKVWSASDYKACKDRIMGIVKDSGGKASLTFDIDLQQVFDTKYSDLSQAIARAHVITEWLNLTDVELMSFDETKPVFFAQYGAYYAVLELKVSENGYTEATMLQLDSFNG